MRPYYAIFASLLLGSVLSAQPAQVSRILRNFDFEERQLGNPEELPMNWTKLQGTGMPHYVNGKLSTDKCRSGKYSFRFDLNGGSLIYRYDPKSLKVLRGATYRVEGYVQTAVMPHARARLAAYFTDLDGLPIPATTRQSELYAARSDPEDWRRLSVELSAEQGAAFLVVELQLLQPMLYEASTLGDRALYPQDIHGTAWFDDVVVAQVPHVAMSTDHPGNIFRRSDQLKLDVLISDRFTDDLAAQLILRDAAGKTVYQRSGAIDATNSQQLSPGQKRATLSLPDIPPGWYQASLLITSQGQPIEQQSLDLVRLADDATAQAADPRFGIIAVDLPFDGWSELPKLLPYLSAGRVKLAVWTAAGDIQQVDPNGFDRLLEQFQEQGITPTACLVDLPPQVAAKVGGKEWPRLLHAKVEDWQPQLAYMVARHANHLDRWQLGADGSEAFVTQKEMRQVYQLMYAEFAKLMQKPDLAMPWPAWYELDGQLPATVALSVPPSVLPSQLPLYTQDLRGKQGHNLSLSLQPLDRERYGRDTQIRDLTQRIIYALAADAQRIDLPLPFTVRTQGTTLVKQPQELMLIMRTIITVLGGATFRGTVPLDENVEAFLFEKNEQGILALWNRGNEGGLKQLTLQVGERPRRVDLWGNVTPLMCAESDRRSGVVQLELGLNPIFLIDIDGQQAQLRASVNLDRPLLESSFKTHSRRLKFVNPYKQTIAGSIRLKAPPGWTINPATLAYSVNPGETFDREITISFPYNSFAGTKLLLAEFEVQADRTSTFTAPIPLKLGLSDVGLQTLALRDGKDVLVQQMITNYGSRPIDYTAFAIYPGQARQERLVTNLAPGRTTIKRYRFPDAPKADVKVRSGLREISGTRILNDEVEIR